MLAACSVMTLVACASMGSKTPSELVQQRAGERWQALIAGDLSKAYSYTTTGFRALVSLEAYRGRIGSAAKWVGAEVNKVDCAEAAKCQVKIRLDFQPVIGGKPSGSSYSTYLDETWLLEEGQWSIYQSIKN